jgi:hypothetical protein
MIPAIGGKAGPVQTYAAELQGAGDRSSQAEPPVGIPVAGVMYRS